MNAVERHSPVIPTAVEGSLLDPHLGGCKFEILLAQILRLRPQLKPIPPFPPKAGRRMGHPQRTGQESKEESSGMSRGSAVNCGATNVNREKGWATRQQQPSNSDTASASQEG